MDGFVTAQAIRDWFDTLLTGRLVKQLRDDLTEARHERDFFKGRAERLELMLWEAKRIQPIAARAPANLKAVGRKSWEEVQQEFVETQRKEAEAQAKPAKEN